ncbi:SDR family oxidoreductase [Aliagarivorans marinus]|uniref:SDR family oxidoreductase n=1 Tax=Aliagarivorans marinus TaxID=561965 RepID=UPI000408DE4D|nr:SDR family oxidoreductase [Aliagarivorans marinus]
MVQQYKELVVITGANSGVGLACAKRFSELGHALLLLDLKVDVVSGLALPHAMALQVDVSDGPAMTEAVQQAEREFGPVDCIVNNAGVIRMDSVANQQSSDFALMFKVNVMGMLNGIQAVLPGMIAREKGTIINMGSLGGHKLIPNQTVYCGSKHAVHGIGEGLREELSQHNVRLSTIAPGAIETALLESNQKPEFKQGQDQWAKSIGGILSAEEVAANIVYVYQQPQHVCIREIVLAATRQQL